MTSPQLHRQLLEQLRQWIVPEDRRHLQGYAEIVELALQFAIAPILTKKCVRQLSLKAIQYKLFQILISFLLT